MTSKRTKKPLSRAAIDTRLKALAKEAVRTVTAFEDHVAQQIGYYVLKGEYDLIKQDDTERLRFEESAYGDLEPTDVQDEIPQLPEEGGDLFNVLREERQKHNRVLLLLNSKDAESKLLEIRELLNVHPRVKR